MKILYNAKYKELMIKQLKEQILFFLQNSIDFSIVVNMDSGVDFNPPLPEEITSGFREFTLFTISGYTFKSAYLENDTFIFEAGFGRENIGAMVYVDLDRVLQIVMGETPIFINVVASVPKQLQKDSLDVFKSKDRNKKFFKGSKK
jgi:hypothetical protein